MKDNRKIKIVGNTRPSGHWGGAVYSTDGLCPTITSGSTIKNGLKIMVNKKEIIEKNFTKIDDSRRIATTKEGDCFAVTTSPRMRPLNKKLDSYVAEKDNREIKQIGTTNGHQSGNVYDENGLSPTLCSVDYKAPIKIITKNEPIIEECIGSTQKHAARTDGTEAPTLTCAMGEGGGHVPMLKLRETTKKGYKEAHEGDGVLTNRGNRKIAKGIVREQHCGNLMTTPDWGTVTSDYRIRKLTPVECERLQAFPDDWTRYGKDGEEISNTQRYKCCGNAVTTTVVTFMINQMFDGLNEES